MKRNLMKGVGKDRLTAPMDDIVSLVRATINDVRRLQTDLCPSLLDDLGIMVTLEWLCRQVRETYKEITVERQINLEEGEIPESLKTVIFLICQEALYNAA